MTLQSEFIKDAEDFLKNFMENFRNIENELIFTERGHLCDHPQDFNFGHASGFMDATLSIRFLNLYNRDPNQIEHDEILKLISTVLPEIKQKIFDAEFR